MKKLSQSLLADLVATKRKEQNMTQQALADATGINRALISRLRKKIFFHLFHSWKHCAKLLDLNQMKFS